MRWRRGLVVLLAGVALDCGRAREIERLRLEHDHLRAELQRLLAADEVANDVQRDGSLIVVAVRSRYLGTLIRAAAARYFDRVELNLTPNLRVHHEEELRVKTLVGKVNAGRWAVDLTVQQVRGTLRGGSPEMSVTQENRLDLVVPVTLHDARGRARVHFEWDAHSLVNAICHDFQVDEEIRARLLPQRYQVRGAFVFEARPDALVARPRFGKGRLRLRIELTPDSWDRILAALEAQDRLMRCGIALDPPAVMEKLAALAWRGFDVRLPAGLVDDVTLPTAVSGSAVVEDRQIDLSVAPHAFRVTRDHMWYSVEVKTAVRPAGAGAAH